MNIVIAGTGMPDVIQTVSEIKAAGSQSIKLLGFLDDDPSHANRNLGEYRILGGFSWIVNNPEVRVFNSIMRTPTLRSKTSEALRALGARFISLIHPTSSVNYASLGNGCYVGKNVHLEFGSAVDDGTVILANTTVGHDSKIGCNCFLGSGVHIQGHSVIEDEVFIGAGTVIHPKVTVRKGVRIDANGVITTDTKEKGIYFNNRMRYFG